MSNHLWTRPGGIWADDTNLLAAELADLDAKTVDSISATGGVYSLTDDLIIGAPGGTLIEFDCLVTFPDRLVVNTLEVSGTGTFGGDATFLGNTTIGQDATTILTVNSYTYFNDIVGFYGGVAFYDDVFITANLQFDGNADFHGGSVTLGASGADALTVNSFTQFNDLTSFNNDVFCNGALSVDGFTALHGMSASGSVFLNSNVSLGGSGANSVQVFGHTDFRAPWGSATGGPQTFRITTGANANASYSPNDWDVVIIPSSIVGPLDYAIADVPTDGVTMRFVTKCTTSAVNIKWGSSTLKSLQVQNGQTYDVTVCRRLSGWEVMSEVIHP